MNKYPLNFIICLALIFNIQEAYSQNIKLSIPVKVDIGLTFAELKKESGIGISQLPGLALELQSGISLLYKKKLGLNLEGGYFLNTYNYSIEGADYNISQYDPRIKAGLYYLGPELNKYGSRLHVGMSWGVTYYKRDTESHSDNNFSAETYTSGQRSMLVSPEIGLSQVKDNFAMDILIAYNQHIDGAVGMTTDFTSESGTATAKSRNNHLALRLRFYFGLKSPKLKLAPTSFPPSQEQLSDFASRRLDRSHSFETKRSRIKLKIWDNADEDGDIISISNNGVFLSEYEIKNKKKTIVIDLLPGQNEIVVYAHNEGLVPPNTASSVLILGLKKHPITITTSLNRNQAVSIIRQ